MTIRIGKTKYRVDFVEAFWDKPVIATIDYDKRTITLAHIGGITGRKLSQEEQRTAFWHEVVHGILKDMGSKLESNEAFVENIASRLTQIIRQVHPHEGNLVTQFTKGLRELRKEIPRSPRTKKAQAGKDRANPVRRRATQSSGAVRKRSTTTKAV
jgi:hypothetical protein